MQWLRLSSEDASYKYVRYALQPEVTDFSVYSLPLVFCSVSAELLFVHMSHSTSARIYFIKLDNELLILNGLLAISELEQILSFSINHDNIIAYIELISFFFREFRQDGSAVLDLNNRTRLPCEKGDFLSPLTPYPIASPRIYRHPDRNCFRISNVTHNKTSFSHNDIEVNKIGELIHVKSTEFNDVVPEILTKRIAIGFGTDIPSEDTALFTKITTELASSETWATLNRVIKYYRINIRFEKSGQLNCHEFDRERNLIILHNPTYRQDRTQLMQICLILGVSKADSFYGGFLEPAKTTESIHNIAAKYHALNLNCLHTLSRIVLEIPQNEHLVQTLRREGLADFYSAYKSNTEISDLYDIYALFYEKTPTYESYIIRTFLDFSRYLNLQILNLDPQ